MNWDIVIGLEIHVQLKTRTKMFCRCSSEIFGETPNTHVCPVCLGLPGALPVINKEAINKAIIAGLALKSSIQEDTYFERKHYFYPDLSKGYQISQLVKPINVGGEIMVGETKINITRAHLEEDAGKLVHMKEGNESFSLVDFNRSGIPLLEIVSEPEITSAKTAALYAMKIQQLMRYCGASEADMEKGSLRVDANISLKPQGADKLGTKVEVKNMNSFRALERALLYEIERQKNMLEKGERITQETRGWVEDKGQTVSQRSKEEAFDYRYFPDPDLPPLKISSSQIEEIRLRLPELPEQKTGRFVSEYGLTIEQADQVTVDKDLAAWFEEALISYAQTKNQGIKPEKIENSESREVFNWVTNELIRLTSTRQVPISSLKILPSHLAEVLYLKDQGKVTSTGAKSLFEKVFETGDSVVSVLEKENLETSSDTSTIEKFADQVIAENTKAVEDYKAGKEQVMGFLVGNLFRLAKVSIDPSVARKILEEKIKNS